MTTLDNLLNEFRWVTYKEVSDSLMEFDEAGLDDEIRKYPSQYSYYYALMVRAKDLLNDIASELSVTESSARQEAKTSSKVKLTAKDLDDLTAITPEVVEAMKRHREASFLYELLKGLIRALEAKKDMLIQASSNRRAETKLYDK